MWMPYSEPQSLLIINLMSNALKFTNTGGITLSVEHENDRVGKLLVTDTGEGIEPDK